MEEIKYTHKRTTLCYEISDTTKTAMVTQPEGSADLYRKHPEWSIFDIEEMDFDAIFN